MIWNEHLDNPRDPILGKRALKLSQRNGRISDPLTKPGVPLSNSGASVVRNALSIDRRNGSPERIEAAKPVEFRRCPATVSRGFDGL